ncbi:MAG: DegQ family serine endoprotease [Gammaproteobacteria bacterium]
MFLIHRRHLKMIAPIGLFLLAFGLQACSREQQSQSTVQTPAQPAVTQTAPAATAAPSTPARLPNFTGLVEKAAPAVVSITGVRTLKDNGMAEHLFPQLPPDSPFRQFFKHFFGPQGPSGPPQNAKERILGSGFIISSDGYIVTNRHVVVGDSDLKVRLHDRRVFDAKVIGMDKRSDIALVKIDAKDLPTLTLGDSAKLKVGQWVLAIGSPFGFDYSASQGIISALSRNLPDENYVPFIQTDAAVNPGNSGGPLLDLSGQVIGVNSQIFTKSGGFMGLSFAIPINVVKDVIAQLKAHGKVSYGYLGVLIQDMTDALAKSFGLSQPEGALVAKVEPKSPAAEAGVKPGDIITEFDGHPVHDASDLPPLVGSTAVGKQVPLVVLRDGKHLTLHVTIAALKEPKKVEESSAGNGSAHHGRLGVAVQDMSARQRESAGVGDRGVRIVSVDGNTPAAQAGLQPGDIILSFNRHDVSDSESFARLVREAPAGRPIPLLVQRGKQPMYLAVTLPAK